MVSCFARVENLPKEILRDVADAATWTDSEGYLDHLETRPLGVNVVPMIPHSMLRVKVMGMPAAIEREPTAAELDEMCRLVEEAMTQGYVGLSTDNLPFHYLAEDPHRKSKIPTQHATFGELRTLTSVLRRFDRVWQTTPPKDEPLEIGKHFLLTSGLVYGKPLKLTTVAAMDLVPNWWLFRLGRLFATVLNSWVMRGHFWLQSLPARFKVWADGPISPLSEEIDVLRELNEPDLADREARRALLQDPAYRARFAHWWDEGKSGWSVASIRRWLVYEDSQMTRELRDMVVEEAPVAGWAGQSLQEIHDRLMAGTPADDAEAAAFATAKVRTEAEFLLWLFEAYDRDLTWWCISANATHEITREALLDERFLPGFSDAGAHLANMAFYDANLRALRYVAPLGQEAVARLVHRITRLPAEFFGVDAGRLEVGAVADVAVVDPEALAAWDPESSVVVSTRLGHKQRVNRSDGVVRAVVVGGRVAWDTDGAAPELGTERFGRLLVATDAHTRRAHQQPPTQRDEPRVEVQAAS
jgi:N-acyl-D-aspartate/D-glutamate deacylase